MRTNSDSELELGDYVAIFGRRWIWFLIPLFAMPWAAFVYSARQPDQFVSTARVLLGDTAVEEAVGSGSQSISFRDRLLENELRLATSDAAEAEIARRFGVPIDEIPSATVSTQGDADVLEFQATDSNPRSAATIANAWAESYLALKQTQSQESISDAVLLFDAKLAELQEERETIRSDLIRFEDALARADDATRTRAQLRVDRETSRILGQVTLVDAQITATVANITELRLSADLALGGGPRIITLAVPPASPSNAPVSRNIALGLVAGAIAGAAAALLREHLDRAIRTSADLAEFDLPHLGSIPKAARSAKAAQLALACLDDAQSPQAAAYQKVRSSLAFIAADQGLRSVVVTSAVQGEGKTTTSANLATAMAQAGTRTILVDCDLRRPRQHRVFRYKQSPGFTDVVIDRATLEESAWPVPSLAESLVVVPAGALPPHPASFISSSAFARATKELATMGDFTVFDAPPVLPVADTLALAEHADGVVVVISAGQTTREQLRAALDSLAAAGATAIGAVLVGVKVDSSRYNYRYESDEFDWLTTEEEVKSKRSPANSLVIDLRDQPADLANETTAV